MDAKKTPLLFLLLVVCATVGCGINTAVIQPGGNGRQGVLLNYSCGARPCDPIDPTKPTIVLTHGWNPLPKRLHMTFAHSCAKALQCRCGDSYNVLSWDWSGVRVPALNDQPVQVGRCQGRMLAAALRCRGVNPRCTQLVGHSLGTVVISQAASCMADMGPFAQITLLDSPTQFHDEVFCHQAVTRHACVVENYWAPGISGFGAEVGYRGVRNYRVAGQTPVRGLVDLSMSNHVKMMEWYYNTIRCPQASCGFQTSVFVKCCGKHCVCNCPVCGEVSNGEIPTEAPVPPADYSPDNAAQMEEEN